MYVTDATPPLSVVLAVALRRLADAPPGNLSHAAHGMPDMAPGAPAQARRRRGRQSPTWRWLAPLVAMILGAALVFVLFVLGPKMGWWGRS